MIRPLTSTATRLFWRVTAGIPAQCQAAPGTAPLCKPTASSCPGLPRPFPNHRSPGGPCAAAAPVRTPPGPASVSPFCSSSTALRRDRRVLQLQHCQGKVVGEKPPCGHRCEPCTEQVCHKPPSFALTLQFSLFPPSPSPTPRPRSAVASSCASPSLAAFRLQTNMPQYLFCSRLSHHFPAFRTPNPRQPCSAS